MQMIWIAGMVAPLCIIAVALVAYATVGGASAVAVLALGFLGVVILNLRQINALAHWADGDLDAPVPEGRGAWRIPFTRIYRRVRARAAVQRDLAHTIARFQSAAEAVPDGMVVLDAQNRIRWANRRAQRQLGVSPDTDVGTPLVNLLREPAFVRYLDGGDFTEAVVIPSARESGVTLSMQLVPFGIEEKLILCRDITQLEAVARMRRDFIADVSHELKTPLTVISGFVETLQDLDLDERQRQRYLALMEEQAQNMRRLVEDLLTLSSLESEHNPLAEVPFAVAPLLRSLQADINVLSGGGHEVTIDPGPPCEIVGNRDEILSAFSNLCTNAVRYTPAGGRIGLSFRVDPDGSGVFSVTDSGIGIAPEHIPRLTERFYRVDRSRSRATGGTGLGLAIVKHVLLRHQATLEISSAPGAGSTFAVRLPARRVRPAPPPAGQADTAGLTAEARS